MFSNRYRYLLKRYSILKNAYSILNYIPKYVLMHAKRETSRFLKISDALVGNTCMHFFQRCAFTYEYVIRSPQMSDVPYQSSSYTCQLPINNSKTQGCGVGGKISDSDLSKISDSDSLTQRE